MTRKQLQTVIDTGKAFTLMMADGRTYDVPTRDHIHIAPKGTYVIVFTDDEYSLSLPLLTMTGVRYPTEPVDPNGSSEN